MADLFDITGIADVQRRLQEEAAVALPILVIALQQEADTILAASQPLVPIDTSSLHDSGRVLDPVIRGTVAESGVFYGGLEGYQGRVPREYAAKVHFDITMNHPRGGQAHFLSLPLFAATDGMLERLADALRVAL